MNFPTQTVFSCRRELDFPFFEQATLIFLPSRLWLTGSNMIFRWLCGKVTSSGSFAMKKKGTISWDDSLLGGWCFFGGVYGSFVSWESCGYHEVAKWMFQSNRIILRSWYDKTPGLVTSIHDHTLAYKSYQSHTPNPQWWRLTPGNSWMVGSGWVLPFLGWVNLAFRGVSVQTLQKVALYRLLHYLWLHRGHNGLWTNVKGSIIGSCADVKSKNP